jgi:hypothetical protein
MSEFHGEPVGILENEFLRLEYLLNSPRIVRLIPAGKKNIFADLGKESLTTPYGDFYFRGGHRLWHAPEAFPRTYIPDNAGATIRAIKDGVQIIQPVEPETHIVKSIEIALDPGKAQVALNHTLRNDGSEAVLIAPWALSMMRLDGVAIIPQPVGDESVKLPNRNLVLWPYASVNDSRLQLSDEAIIVHTEAKTPPLKLGCFCPQGWMGYWIDGTFFVKRFANPDAVRNYPDWGCNVEIYCNDKFIELETLGPLTNLKSGVSVSHIETWELYNTTKLDWIPVEQQKQIGE